MCQGPVRRLLLWARQPESRTWRGWISGYVLHALGREPIYLDSTYKWEKELKDCKNGGDNHVEPRLEGTTVCVLFYWPSSCFPTAFLVVSTTSGRGIRTNGPVGGWSPEGHFVGRTSF